MSCPPSPTPTGDLNALLGRGSEFEGKLTFEGTVRIDGKFTGTIVTNDVLVVGEGAKVNAEITCGTIIVHGEINGNVRAKSAIELHHPARMRGNVEAPSLMIEKGVIFEGQVQDGGRGEGRREARPCPGPGARRRGEVVARKRDDGQNSGGGRGKTAPASHLRARPAYAILT